VFERIVDVYNSFCFLRKWNKFTIGSLDFRVPTWASDLGLLGHKGKAPATKCFGPVQYAWKLAQWSIAHVLYIDAIYSAQKI